MNDEQAVAQTADDQAKPDTEGAGAQDKTGDIDELLSAFDSTEAKDSPDKSKPEQSSEIDADKVADRVMQRVEAKQAFDRDMHTTVKSIRGDIDPGMADDDFVGAWLDAKAKKDPRLQQAWSERNAKPREFQSVLDKLGEDFQGRFSKIPNKEATEDRAAVTAAVRGASTQAPEPEEKSLEEIRRMPEDEKVRYAREVSKQYAKG